MEVIQYIYGSSKHLIHEQNYKQWQMSVVIICIIVVYLYDILRYNIVFVITT